MTAFYRRHRGFLDALTEIYRAQSWKPKNDPKITPQIWPPFWPPFWPLFLIENLIKICHFWPFLAIFDPPADPPNPKILENGPFGENRGFQACFEPQKGGGGWGFTQGPPKKAIFGHFWPFLAILATFGHFWRFLATFWPPNLTQKWPQKGTHPRPRPPWPDFLYLIIGLLGRKLWICAENEDFSAPPTGAGNVSDFWPHIPDYYYNLLSINP